MQNDYCWLCWLTKMHCLLEMGVKGLETTLFCLSTLFWQQARWKDKRGGDYGSLQRHFSVCKHRNVSNLQVRTMGQFLSIFTWFISHWRHFASFIEFRAWKHINQPHKLDTKDVRKWCSGFYFIGIKFMWLKVSKTITLICKPLIKRFFFL